MLEIQSKFEFVRLKYNIPQIYHKAVGLLLFSSILETSICNVLEAEIYSITERHDRTALCFQSHFILLPRLTAHLNCYIEDP